MSGTLPVGCVGENDPEFETPGLNQADHDVTGVHLVTHIDEAVVASMACSGDSAVAVIPEGPYVVHTIGRQRPE